MRGRAHDDKIRIKAIAALMTGQSIVDVAATFKLPESTVKTWKDGIPEAQLALVRTNKGAEIDNLLYDYLKTVLTSLKTQAEVAGDRAYIEQQPADKLYLLHGTMADKGIRLLEAAARAKSLNVQNVPTTD